MINNKIVIIGKLVTFFGMILSLLVACQYAYIGSVKEIIITGAIGLSNVYAFYAFQKEEKIQNQ